MKKLSKIFKKPFFKNSQFLYIELLIVLIIIATFAITIFTTIIHTESTDAHLQKQAESINTIMLEAFDGASSILNDVGTQFVAHNPKTDKEIGRFLTQRSKALVQSHDPHLHNIFTLPQFNFRKDKYVIYLDPHDITQYKTAEYKGALSSFVNEVQKPKALPWEMHIFPPQIGFPSGYWSFPVRLGITDNELNYLGALGIGISMASLVEKIQKCLEEHYHFIIIDKNFSPVLQSITTEHPVDQRSEYDNAIFKNRRDFNQNEGELKNPIYHKDIVYSYYKKLVGYEYIILIGFDKTRAWQSFLLLVFPRILEYVGMGVICLLLLYLSRRRMIKTARAANQEKAKFLLDLVRGVKVNSVLSHAEYLLKYFRGEENMKLSSKDIIEGVQAIYDEAINIRNLTTAELELEKIDVLHIIKDCITICEKDALLHGITIESRLEEGLPPLIADPLRIQQIILSLTKIALSCMPKGGVVNIATSWDKLKNELVIVIKDNGFGLTILEMERIQNRFKGNEADAIEGYLSIKGIKDLIALHNGLYSMECIPRAGNKVTVRFPYQLSPPSFPTGPHPKKNNVIDLSSFWGRTKK